jgi:hypothetical protein
MQVNETVSSAESLSLTPFTNSDEEPSLDTQSMFKGVSHTGPSGSLHLKKKEELPGECPECKEGKFLFRSIQTDRMTKVKKVTQECWSIKCKPLEFPLSQVRKDFLKSLGKGEEYAAYFFKPNAGLSEYGIQQHVRRDIETPDWHNSKFL